MKVFAFLVIAVASVAAKGSGPYLPSGWKPDGPAFYLPSENVKANRITDLVLDGSEASGSDSLREYGPPAISAHNVVEPNPAEIPTADLDSSEASGSDFLREYGTPVLSENIINQGLPDAVIEQNFNFEVKSEVPEVSVEVSSEQEAAVTESAEQSTLAINIDVLIIDDKEIESQTTVESTEASLAATQFENILSEKNVDASEASEASEAVPQTTESASQDATVSGNVGDLSVQNIPDIITKVDVPEASEAVLQTTESASQDATVSENVGDLSVQNIPDIIAKLENEITSEQVEFRNLNKQAEVGSLEQAPEGFLEYGPPGFTEYGPPKEEFVSIESNAARRRRFSPKIRLSKKH